MPGYREGSLGSQEQAWCCGYWEKLGLQMSHEDKLVYFTTNLWVAKNKNKKVFFSKGIYIQNIHIQYIYTHIYLYYMYVLEQMISAERREYFLVIFNLKVIPPPGNWSTKFCLPQMRKVRPDPFLLFSGENDESSCTSTPSFTNSCGIGQRVKAIEMQAKKTVPRA